MQGSRNRLDQVSAWMLIGLGGVLLVSGLLSLARAASAGDWAAVVLTAVLMLVLAAGVARGVRQLRRAGRR